jgi:hypothetical protein
MIVGGFAFGFEPPLFLFGLGDGHTANEWAQAVERGRSDDDSRNRSADGLGGS